MNQHIKHVVLVLSCLIGGGAIAQPGDLPFPFNPPCGMAPNTSYDLSSEGVIDLELVGTEVGTDDVPSSHGWCGRTLHAVNGTTFLRVEDGSGSGEATRFARHDSLPVLGRENDLMPSRYQWIDAEVQAITWPYGTAVERPYQPALDPKRPVLVLRVPGPDGAKWMAALLEVKEASREVYVNPLAEAPEGELLRW